MRLARHARRAPRSVPQRHGRPGATAAKQDLRRCFIKTWPLENSRAGSSPIAAHLWAGGWHTPSGAPPTSPVFTRAAVARSLPGSPQGVSPAPSATLRGACLGHAGGDAGLPTGVLLRGGLLGGFILTWTLVPEMAPACQAHPNLGGLTALGGTSRGQPPPLGVPGGGLSCSQPGAQINTSLEVPESLWGHLSSPVWGPWLTSSPLETAFLAGLHTRSELLTSGAAGVRRAQGCLSGRISEGCPRPAPGAWPLQAEEQRLCPHPVWGEGRGSWGGIWRSRKLVGGRCWSALVHGQLTRQPCKGSGQGSAEGHDQARGGLGHRCSESSSFSRVPGSEQWLAWTGRPAS